MGACRPTARFGKSVQVMCGIGLGRFSPAASVTQEWRWRSRLSSEGVFWGGLSVVKPASKNFFEIPIDK